jgi:acyl-CoA synthetase (NDP forming)
MTAGFAEASEEGAQLQQLIRSIAHESEMRVLGPNCLGFLNVPAGVAAAATGALLEGGAASPGPVSLVTQSGAMGFVSLLSRGRDHGMGFRYVVALGNEADVDVAEVVGDLAADEETEVIVLLLEGIRRPEVFRSSLRAAASAGKRVVVLKSGRTTAGSMAAMAHTASLAGSSVVHHAVFAADGAIEVTDLDELWHVAQLLADRRVGGRRVLAATTSGGLGGLLGDHLGEAGLLMAEPDAVTLDGLRHLLPEFASLSNPLDLTGVVGGGEGEGDTWRRVLEILDSDPNTDLVVLGLIVARRDYGSVASSIIQTAQHMRKPLVIVSPGGSVADAALADIKQQGIPVFTSISCCARSLAASAGIDIVGPQRVSTGEHRSTIGAAPLSQEETELLLRMYGLPSAEGIVCSSITEARAAAGRIGYPVVLKALSRELIHKTDVGGVIVGIDNEAQLLAVIEELRAKLGETSLLVQRLVDGGVECIVGAFRDPQFGPCILVGAGGVLTELIADSQVLLPPFTFDEACSALRRLRMFPLLNGHRGSQMADVAALARVIVDLGRLALEHDEVVAVDLNPVIVQAVGSGAAIVDARIITEMAGRHALELTQ